MIISKKKAITYLLLTMTFVYLWIEILNDFELLSVLSASIFPIMIGSLSFMWVYKTSKELRGKERRIWKVIGIGLIFHVTGNIIWFIGAINNIIYQAPDISYLFWLLAYFLILIALIYKMRLLGSGITTNPYLFNTAIFIIVVSAIFIQYFVRPYIASTESLFQQIVLGILYPIVDISLLFVTTLLFYLSRHTKDSTVLLCFMTAIYLSIMGDAITAFMKSNKEYFQLLIEPLWVGSLLVIGFAGLFAQRNKSRLFETKVTTKDKESSFPYISISLLIILVFQSAHWQFNPMNIGLVLVFFMIVGRNLVIIGKNKKLMLQYRVLAFQDSLTGLSNRSSFKLDLENAIEKASKDNSSFYILLMDLDRFKMINDTLGHFVGDQLLKFTSEKLKNELDSKSRLYRLGGDEFVVLIEDGSVEKCEATASQIIGVFNKTFTIQQHEITITPSVGISSYPVNGKDSDTLFKAADAAMYLAKGQGRNNYQFYNSELNHVLTRKLMIENELRKAIIRDELELYYQPKFNIRTRQLMGMEALIRWDSKKLGRISPAEFIPVAEDTGLIVNIGEWVLRRACIQMKQWQDQGYQSHSISVNVSVQQFKQSNLVNTVENILKETDLNPMYLELEITESIMQNVEESKKVLASLGEIGLKISLDDFGTGYSSLHVLKNLPINTLKIDKTFIDDIKVKNDQSMVKGIIDIAQNLKLEIVAEGIEYEYQLDVLAHYQCDYGQGYLFSEPITAYDFERTYLNKMEKVVELMTV
jgi:diguanylate cyclase (GGDEF)-like protein